MHGSCRHKQRVRCLQYSFIRRWKTSVHCASRRPTTSISWRLRKTATLSVWRRSAMTICAIRRSSRSRPEPLLHRDAEMGGPLPGQAATAHGNGAVAMITRATIGRPGDKSLTFLHHRSLSPRHQHLPQNAKSVTHVSGTFRYLSLKSGNFGCRARGRGSVGPKTMAA